VLDRMLAEFSAADIMSPSAPLPLVTPVAPEGRLAFPGGVRVDEATGRLYIADTNHHRVLVTTLDGEEVAAFGSGKPGLEDGPAATARFRFPQGLALGDGVLYVADTENHAIRAVDLATGAVTTLAGTGEQ